MIIMETLFMFLNVQCKSRYTRIGNLQMLLEIGLFKKKKTDKQKKRKAKKKKKKRKKKRKEIKIALSLRYPNFYFYNKRRNMLRCHCPNTK